MTIELKSGECFIEVVSGVEGNCLYVGDENGGYRISGPKPWGGGRTIHQFKVNIKELMRELQALADVNE